LRAGHDSRSNFSWISAGFSQGAHQPSAKARIEGIIARSTKPTSPPTVWYGLTLVGQELCAALVNVIDVAQRLKRKEVTTAGTR